MEGRSLLGHPGASQGIAVWEQEKGLEQPLERGCGGQVLVWGCQEEPGLSQERLRTKKGPIPPIGRTGLVESIWSLEGSGSLEDAVDGWSAQPRCPCDGSHARSIGLELLHLLCLLWSDLGSGVDALGTA